MGSHQSNDAIKKVKHFFCSDSVATGIVAGVGSMIGFCLALTLGFWIAKQSPSDHIRWYGGMFIVLILLLRHYAKGRAHLVVTKTLIITLFITFLGFIYFLFYTHQIQFE